MGLQPKGGNGTTRAAERRSESALERRLRRALEAEALGRLVGGVVHELNDSLSVIAGHCQRLREGRAGAPGIGADLDRIGLAAEEAAALTRRLASFAPGEEPTLGPVELGGFFEGLTPLLLRVLRADLELHLRLPDELPPVRAARRALERLVLDLALNATRFAEAGSDFSIEVRGPTQASSDASDLRLRIADHARGPEARGRSRELARAAGGSPLEASATAPLTFEVDLPVCAELPGRAELFPRSSELSGSETILVCDDDPGVRRVLCESLEASGYRVLSAEDGQRALELEGGLDGPLHLVVTDVVMPGVSGGRLSEALRRRRRNLGVLYVTGYPREIAGRHCRPVERDGWLPKPFTPLELLQQVRRVLDRGGAPVAG